MNQSDQKRVFWGHSLADYVQMFKLTDQELAKHLLDVRGGPSSFNAEMHANGKQVTSCDTLYAATSEKLALEVRNNLIDPKLLSEAYASFKLEQQKNIDTFLTDFALGKGENRYITAKLPNLPFADHEFELALLHHSLFNQQASTLESIMETIRELARVAHEVRIFPLLDNNGGNSSLLAPVTLLLQQQEFGVEIKHVDFEIQSYSNAMLRIWSLICEMS